MLFRGDSFHHGLIRLDNRSVDRCFDVVIDLMVHQQTHIARHHLHLAEQFSEDLARRCRQARLGGPLDPPIWDPSMSQLD